MPAIVSVLSLDRAQGLHHPQRRVGTLALVRSLRLIASVLGAAALVALCAPGAALAGTYSWSQPGDFSGTQGALKYGAPSWYYDSGSPLTGLAPLSWDASASEWNNGSAHETVGVSGGGLVMHAALGDAVTVAWNDPFPSGQPVTVLYSESGTCTLFGVTDQDGTAVSPGVPTQVTGSLYLTTGVVSAGCTEDVQIQLQATTPTVTLTNPGNGTVYTNGEPQLSGSASTAFDASGAVAVAVYSGGSVGGSPVQTLIAARAANGAYTATPTTPLPNGTYTAQAEQDDPVGGQQNFSVPVTFTLTSGAGSNGAIPGLTLNSLGSRPLTTSTPTLTGTAGTQPGDSNQAALLVYSGNSVSGSPVRQETGAVGSGGQFAIQVAPGLADGAYTAVATQSAPGLVGFSPAVSFHIKVHPPALTLGYPQRHSSVPRSSLFFFGQAGGDIDDSKTVTVQLWSGTHARGKALGKVNVRVRDAAWSLQWPRRLSLGRYTIRAVQSDDVGHTTTTPARSFTVVPGLPVIGSTVSLTRSGGAALRVSCLPRGQGACRGTVLVVTVQNLRTTSGGPAGPVRLLFTSVTVPDGGSSLIRGTVPASLARTLRAAGGVTVRVTVALRHSSGSTTSATAGRALKISP